MHNSKSATPGVLINMYICVTQIPIKIQNIINTLESSFLCLPSGFQPTPAHPTPRHQNPSSDMGASASWCSLFQDFMKTESVQSVCALLCKAHLKDFNQCFKMRVGPWLVWLSGLSASLRTERSLVRFPIRVLAWVVGQVPGCGHIRGN